MPNLFKLLFISLLVTAAATSLFAPTYVSHGDGNDDVAAVPEKTQQTYPNLSTQLNHLAESYSSGHMSAQQAAGEAPVHPAVL